MKKCFREESVEFHQQYTPGKNGYKHVMSVTLVLESLLNVGFYIKNGGCGLNGLRKGNAVSFRNSNTYFFLNIILHSYMEYE